MALIDEFQEWGARVVEVPREHRTLLRCPVRERDFIDGPEERIRQALLHFFVDLANGISFVLGAERERHDIDLRWPASEDFRPPTPPLLIVETKVDGVAGDWTNEQLARYLGETKGDLGVVFTGHRMWRLELTSGGAQSVTMASLAELAALVRQRAERDPLAEARVDFEAARTGDIEALRRLVARFRYSTFVLSVAGQDVACRDLRFTDDALEYRQADCYVRQRSRVMLSDVTRLVRIAA